MTTETDLLPLPERFSFMEWETHMRDYARANLAELQREVEGLRAEVERLSALLGRTEHSLANIANAQYLRAERLAGALRRYGVHDHACVVANIPICTCGLDAALDQETTNG